VLLNLHVDAKNEENKAAFNKAKIEIIPEVKNKIEPKSI